MHPSESVSQHSHAEVVKRNGQIKFELCRFHTFMQTVD